MPLMLGAIGMLVGVLLHQARNGFDFGNQLFGNFVAVSGDAHQAKVAQDIFRQEVRYERSLQIREDIRDVNKMMLESVQTHLFMGSIILGICFGMFIEGYPPDETARTLQDLWLVFTGWSATFTLLSLWLALCFQSKISSCARERLLRKHRFQMPDELMVGKMGGNNLVNQMAVFHEKVLSMVHQNVKKDEEAAAEIYKPPKGGWRGNFRVEVENNEGMQLDCEPMRKGMRGWIHPNRDGYLPNTILDMPSFLVGETLVRSQWECRADTPLLLRVYGEATLYVAARCLRHPGEDANLQINGQVPLWPEDELPYLTMGAHRDWRGGSGHGEFHRVNGFSIYVDTANVELPLYKIVLQTPQDEEQGDNSVTVCVQWNFKVGCEALLVMLRKGQVHCKEEDWPIVEFNDEIRQVMPLRDYSGKFMRWGVACLCFAAFFTYEARHWMIGKRIIWWFESILLVFSLTPAMLAIVFVPIYVTGTSLTDLGSPNTPEGEASPSSFVARNLENMVTSRFASSSALGSPKEAATPAQARRASLFDGGNGDTADSPSVALYEDFKPVRSGSKESFVFQGDGGGNGDAPVPPAAPGGGGDAAEAPPGSATARWAGAVADENEMASADLTHFSYMRGLGQNALTSICMDPQRAAGQREAGDQQLGPDGGRRETSLLSACGSAGVQVGTQCREVVVATSSGRRPRFCPGPARASVNRHDSVATPIGVACPVMEDSSPRWDELERGVEPAYGASGHGRSSQRRGSTISVNSSTSRPSIGQLPHNFGDIQEAGSNAYNKLPSFMKPIDADNSLMVEGETAKSLRSTLKRFRMWTAVLRTLFLSSLSFALASPHLWFESLVEGVDSREGTEALAPESLEWMKWEVAWPPFFRPTAALLEPGEDEILWIAAGATLRALRRGDAGASATAAVGAPATAGTWAFRPAGPAVLLPGPAHGLAFPEGGAVTLASSSSSPAGRRLAAVGDAGTFEVWLPQAPAAAASGEGLGITAAEPAEPAGATASLPDSLPPTVTAAAAALETVGVGGPHTAAVAAAGGDEATTGIYLCTTGGVAGQAENGTSAGSADAGGGAPLFVLARLEASGGGATGTPDLVQGAVTALHAAPPGHAGCGGAEEPVLWIAAAGGHIAALGLSSGQVLETFGSPLGGTGASVLALTGNSSHLVAVVAGGAEGLGRRPEVFSVLCPALPSAASSEEL